MNLLKQLQGRIRGWLPKEPSSPSPRKIKMVEVNLKPKRPTKTRLALFLLAIFAVVFSTLSILDVLGSGSYAPFAAGAVAALASAVLSALVWKPSNQSAKRIETSKELKQ